MKYWMWSGWTRDVLSSATGAASGNERIVTVKQAKSFDLYERRTIEVAVGDMLLLTANRNQPGFHATNGETVTVSAVEEKGPIRVEDGRELPPFFA